MRSAGRRREVMVSLVSAGISESTASDQSPRTVWRNSRAVGYQGVRSRYRSEYWQYLWRSVRRTPGRMARAIALAINGEHMIRYTAEDLLPRLVGDGAVQGGAQRRKPD